jgi:DNA-binding transcriptional LysR family regulator
MQRYRQHAPNVRFVLREMGSHEQAMALEKGEIDIGLLQTPVAIHGRMNQCLVARDRFIAAVHDDFPIGDDGMVSLRDLAREGIVFFPPNQLPLIHASICSAIREIGEEVRIVQEASRAVTILACVAARCGVSLLTSTTNKLQVEGVRYCEIRERAILPEIDTSAIWPRRSKPTLADAFAKMLVRVQ